MADLQRFNPITKRLGELANYLSVSVDPVIREIAITGISSNSNSINEGDAFLALPGATAHGATYIPIAVERGARAVITDNAGAQLSSAQKSAIPVLVIPNPRSESGYLADWFFDSPSKAMYVAGITGTNGKTTATYLLNQIWKFADQASGLIGTVGIQIAEDFYPAVRTTPEADVIQSILSVMQERHLRNVAMEASSHALVQNRLDGVKFAAAGFTNLTQDHLDFHGDMEHYYLAKKSLFTAEFSEHAFVNIDNAFGQRLAGEISIPTSTLSKDNRKATWYFDEIKPLENGYEVSI